MFNLFKKIHDYFFPKERKPYSEKRKSWFRKYFKKYNQKAEVKAYKHEWYLKNKEKAYAKKKEGRRLAREAKLQAKQDKNSHS